VLDYLSSSLSTQAVAAVTGGEQGIAVMCVGGEGVVGIEGELIAMVGCRVAVTVVLVPGASIGYFVSSIEGMVHAVESGRVAGGVINIGMVIAAMTRGYLI
jgi:hypothetical protein